MKLISLNKKFVSNSALIGACAAELLDKKYRESEGIMLITDSFALLPVKYISKNATVLHVVNYRILEEKPFKSVELEVLPLFENIVLDKVLADNLPPRLLSLLTSPDELVKLRVFTRSSAEFAFYDKVYNFVKKVLFCKGQTFTEDFKIKKSDVSYSNPADLGKITRKNPDKPQKGFMFVKQSGEAEFNLLPKADFAFSYASGDFDLLIKPSPTNSFHDQQEEYDLVKSLAYLANPEEAINNTVTSKISDFANKKQILETVQQALSGSIVSGQRYLFVGSELFIVV